ncbi:MAG: EAL domain-containing protein [Gammaproteobacteria bacterium]|nr:EAL domain-containing protein [Gammaproteobacteria bacterium]
MAMLAIVALVFVTFVYTGEYRYISEFVFTCGIFVAVRLILVRLFKTKVRPEHYISFANYYAISSLLLGLVWAFLSLAYIDVNHDDLRTFLTIVNIGLITAASGSLSVWMRAYLGFTVPQVIALIIIYVISDNYFVVAAVLVFSWFMLVVAKNNNLKFKQGRLLIRENIKLIDKMEVEIQNRIQAQSGLEKAQEVLEDMVKTRTSELVDINLDLKEQINRRRDVEKDLQHLAYYDVLTGLPNRSLLIQRLKEAVAKAKRSKSLFGVLFVDLDRFKTINDSLGHSIGDQLIKQVAVRIQNALRETDIVARNGGDEFVIIIEEMNDVREAFVVAEKVIEAINKVFEISGHIVHVGTSIGISVYPIDGEDALDLLKMSDTAMYCAKEIGSNNFEFYSSEMSNRIKGRLELENALRTALKNKELYMVYQPQVDIHTNKTSGFEALIRWNSSIFGSVSPAEFVPVLEETGMIYTVGEWIIEEVIDFIKSGKTRGAKVSINLSALQCGVVKYSEKIKSYITAAEVDPALIEFEITESVLINDFSKTEAFLTSINQLGCTIALDDFGTGYTSFSYLAKLPIDVIKIDRSLISDIDTQKSLQDIVKAIVTMCHSLDIENVFEGVETETELDMVRQLNAKIIQGYYFSKPLELTEIDKWFEENQ